MPVGLETELRMEARYRRERLARYKARMYGARAFSAFRLKELERDCHAAETRLRRVQPSRHPAPRPE